MRLFAEEKTGIFTADTTQTTNLLAKYAMEGAAAGFALHQVWQRCIPLCALLNSGDHIVSSSGFGATHSLFINYFPKWNIQTSYFDINQPDY
jgi:O-succinylhomoserine sulfhydrylase